MQMIWKSKHMTKTGFKGHSFTQIEVIIQEHHKEEMYKEWWSTTISSKMNQRFDLINLEEDENHAPSNMVSHTVRQVDWPVAWVMSLASCGNLCIRNTQSFILCPIQESGGIALSCMMNLGSSEQWNPEQWKLKQSVSSENGSWPWTSTWGTRMAPLVAMICFQSLWPKEGLLWSACQWCTEW